MVRCETSRGESSCEGSRTRRRRKITQPFFNRCSSSYSSLWWSSSWWWSGLVCKMNMMIATLSFPGGGLILNLGSGSLRDAVRQHGGVTYYHIFKFQECWILGLAWYETFIILISSWSTVVIVIVIVTVLPNWHHCHRNRLKALNFLNLMPDKSTHHVPIKSP